MLTLYRGHWIVLLSDIELTAEATEIGTNTPLPTTVRASLEEGPSVCLKRARALIDTYLGVQQVPARTGAGLGSQPPSKRPIGMLPPVR